MSQDQIQKEGLPEVAHIRHRKPIALVLIIIVILISLSWFFINKKHQPSPQQTEETYTVPTESQSVTLTKPQADVTPKISPEITQQQLAIVQEKQKELQQRLAAPLMLVQNQSTSDVGAQQNIATKSKSEMATSIGPLNSIIAEGHLIHAILESATNSDLPGFLRAIISESVYSEDGTRILIPQGSRLIGEYKNGVLNGQSRIFIAWLRLITPQGISLQLNSPGVDSLGVAGMGADVIDRHFWERFGTASLLSLIGAGAANLGAASTDPNNSVSEYRAAAANSFAQSAEGSLQEKGNIAATLSTYQGKPIVVFVAHDLHFENIKQPSYQIF